MEKKLPRYHSVLLLVQQLQEQLCSWKQIAYDLVQAGGGMHEAPEQAMPQRVFCEMEYLSKFGIVMVPEDMDQWRWRGCMPTSHLG